MPGDLRDKLALAMLAACLAGMGGCMAMEQSMRPKSGSHASAWAPGLVPQDDVGAGASGARAMAAYDSAMAMVDAGQYAKAEPAFAQLVGQFRQIGDADRTSKSWFWVAYCMEKQGDLSGSAGEYRKLADEFPASQAAQVAQGRLERMRMPPVPGKGK